MALFSRHFAKPDAPELVLLHGWGTHSGIWQPLIAQLEKNYAITLVDLPGLGRSAADIPQPYTLDAVVELLAEVVPQNVILLGWSLGGIVAMAFAQRYPQRVSRLITLGSSPCFVQQDDWSCAMDEATFSGFEQSVAENTGKTLQRFNMLQVQGSATARADLKVLKALLSEIKMPAVDGLLGSLALLRADYRGLYAALQLPTLHILCELDTLAPSSIVEQLPALSSTAEVRVLPQQSHVPFLSSPDQLAECMQGWLQ
ncbi:MAG: pimeloyl-ACP methyl ester esterase BioH [Amphritea sp.]